VCNHFQYESLFVDYSYQYVFLVWTAANVVVVSQHAMNL